jgi:hypothetical protein
MPAAPDSSIPQKPSQALFAVTPRAAKNIVLRSPGIPLEQCSIFPVCFVRNR